VHNQLPAVLQHNLSGAIGLFSQLDLPISLTFLRRFPSETEAAWLSSSRMANWLKANSYSGRQSAADLTAHLRAAVTGRTAGLAAEAGEVIVLTLVNLLSYLRTPASRSGDAHQGSAAGPSRRTDLPVLAPSRHFPRRDPARRDR
jgi:hypothetical protein